MEQGSSRAKLSPHLHSSLLLQYPDVPISVKRAYWQAIVDVFDGMLINTTQSPVNATSIRNLIARNQRVVFYATDYEEVYSVL